MNFSQCVNQNVKILGRRLHSPSLKNVAFLYVIEQFFLICHTFVCRFFSREPRLARLLSTQPNLQTNVWKIKKINWASSSQATSFKLGEYNLLHSILTLRFVKMASKTVIRPMLYLLVCIFYYDASFSQLLSLLLLISYLSWT